MGILDILAEANIKDWLKRKEQPGYVPPPPVKNTSFGKPIEEHIFDEIKDLLEKAYATSAPETRKALLNKATNLEIRLTVSYESQGYPFLAQRVQGALFRYRMTLAQKASGQVSNTPQDIQTK